MKKLSDMNLGALVELTRYAKDFFSANYLPLIRKNLEEVVVGEDRCVVATCLPTVAVTSLLRGRDKVEPAHSRAQYIHYVTKATTMSSGRIILGPLNPNVENAQADDTWVIIIMEKHPTSSDFCKSREFFGNAAWHFIQVGKLQP
ncbi:MAG: hypothetical protein RL094_456 [Candidatus Parcubacteria bacterium]|jgi:hypothetical protein